jgi:predicted phosphodiesterase
MSKPLRIQYASDLHLEHFKIAFPHDLNPRQLIVPDPAAEVLVLAGDIGNPDEPIYKFFLEWCSKSWKKVIVVAGNHEFYSTPSTRRTITERLDSIRAAVSTFPNVHFLNREKVEVRPGVWILGCTLWSAIPEDSKYDAAASINDYRLIATEKEKLFTVDNQNAWHREDAAWLKEELAAVADISGGATAIVVTHHMPTFKTISRKFRGHPLNYCFASNLDSLIEMSKPAVWFCGHTHEGGEYTVGKTRILLNPRGYPFEHVSTRNPQRVVDLRF